MTGGATGSVAVPKLDAIPPDRQSILKALLTRSDGTVVDKDSILHYATCADSNCARCKFAVNADVWKTQLPLHNEKMAGGSTTTTTATTWLQWRDLGAGCVACNAAGLLGRMATFSVNTKDGLQLCHLKAHQKSPAHQQAAEAYTQQSAELLAGAGAPSAVAFETLLRELQ